VHAALDDQWGAAQVLHQHHLELFEALFIDTNPIPVKAALAMMGKIEEMYRLPLCEMAATDRETLRVVLTHYGLIA